MFQVNEEGQYSLHHLVQTVVCDRLYRLGLQAATLREACRAIDYSWQSSAAVAFQVGTTHLWVSFSHSEIEHPGGRIEAVGLLLRSRPRVRVVHDIELMSDIRNGERFGIVINLMPIVRDIEERTGEKLIP